MSIRCSGFEIHLFRAAQGSAIGVSKGMCCFKGVNDCLGALGSSKRCVVYRIMSVIS